MPTDNIDKSKVVDIDVASNLASNAMDELGKSSILAHGKIHIHEGICNTPIL